MHVLGVLLFDKPSFKHVVVTGTILASDGSKMSKSKGNYPDPSVIFDKYGADALRCYLMLSPLMKAEDINFNEETLKEVYRKMIMLTENVKSFYELYGKENVVLDNSSSDHILDKWIVSKTNTTITEITTAMESYDTVTSTSTLMQFIDEISTWYIRRSRDRFKFEDKKEKQKAIQTLGYVLHTLAKLMAPIAPFIAEDIQQCLRKENKKLAESIHLESWPVADIKKMSKQLNKEMQQVRDIVSKALETREKAKIPIRQILAKIEIQGINLDKVYLPLIAEEVNVKEVVQKKGETFTIILDTKITPELMKEGMVRELIRIVNGYRKAQGMNIDDRIQLVISMEENLTAFEEELKQKVGAKTLTWIKKGEKIVGYSLVKKEQIKEKEVEIAFKKC